MATEPQHSEIMSGAPSSSEPAGVSADAALIVAALGRIEAAARDQGAVLGRLRSALGDMAQAIANAKTVADSETAAAMLDEFEHRVDAMIEIAGGAPVTNPAVPEARIAAAAAESDQVPTVSGVVLRLGPGEALPEPAIAQTAQPADAAGDKAPTVAMLTAMVEALSASIQEPEPQVVAPAAAPAALPGEAAEHETALLASFEQMEARPFPPPDEGTAVIFTARPQPEFVPEPPAPSEPAATPEPEQAAATQSHQAVEPAPAESPSAAGPAADFDPTDFLFGPEPEPDPAAFLLDPAPPPRTQHAVVLPQPEFVATPAEPPPAQDLQAQDLPAQDLPANEPLPQPAAEIPQPVQPAPQPAPHDPLRALKAMSENERLAIFS